MICMLMLILIDNSSPFSFMAVNIKTYSFVIQFDICLGAHTMLSALNNFFQLLKRLNHVNYIFISLPLFNINSFLNQFILDQYQFGRPPYLFLYHHQHFFLNLFHKSSLSSSSYQLHIHCLHLKFSLQIHFCLQYLHLIPPHLAENYLMLCLSYLIFIACINNMTLFSDDPIKRVQGLLLFVAAVVVVVYAISLMVVVHDRYT